jgi:hypothetical protein
VNFSCEKSEKLANKSRMAKKHFFFIINWIC